ncbi:MAG: tyrosine-type recombinase/integrase [Acidobacteria bacterium]|nr:tyrosine-type recombinase/integrase [Acidobacteriota bacterium]
MKQAGAGSEMPGLAREAMEFVEAQASPATRRMYQSDVQDLARFVSGRGRTIAEASREDLVGWIRSLETRVVRGKRGVEGATQARKLSVIKSLFEFLRTKGAIESNPAADLKPPRVDRSQGKTPCPSKREAELLLGVMDPETARGLRDRAIGMILFGQGLRVSEVARLQRKQLTTEDGYTVIRLVGKGGAIVKSVLSPEVDQALQVHLRRNVPHGEYVFRAMPTNAKYHEGKGRDPRTRPIGTRSILVMLKCYARRAGLDPGSIRAHGGRVFFITEAYRRTRDLERVARAVGHRSLGTTRRYLRYLEEPKDHAALAVKLVPRETLLEPKEEHHGRED